MGQNKERKFEKLMKEGIRDELNIDEILNNMANLNDISWDLQKLEGIKQVKQVMESLLCQELPSGQLGRLRYILGNAWYEIHILELQKDNHGDWKWDQSELEKAIFNFRSAIIHLTQDKFNKIGLRETYTNLGNCMSSLGRFVDAIEYWDKALEISADFGMSLGNKGMALIRYSQAVYDKGHVGIILKYAHDILNKAIKQPINNEAKEVFAKSLEFVQKNLPKGILDNEIDMESFSLGNSEEEINYRRWCLKNQLFLNPLNDLGFYPIASHDCLNCPPYIVDIEDPKFYLGFFNQIKQEYITARILYYEGLTSSTTHFSDKGVLLYNTLDYPVYSLNIEKQKIAFRSLYSIFDKIAYFLDYYMDLKNPQRKITFRNIWFDNLKKEHGIRKEFDSLENWPVRGLYYLSKDIYDPDFQDVVEPDAQFLNEIRNHLEHKYLKIHEFDFSIPQKPPNKEFKVLIDCLAYSISRHDFSEKVLKLLKLTRCAIIYLILGANQEERKKVDNKDQASKRGVLAFDNYNDELKV